jgi:L-lactate dehydrogenase (cytochrome)
MFHFMWKVHSLKLNVVIYKYAGKDGTKTYNMYHSETLIEKELMDEDKKGSFDESTIDEAWTEAQKEDDITNVDPDAKPPLESLINLDDFEKAFEKSGSKKSWAYIAGASNDLLSLNANKSYWQKLWFRPRIMRKVKDINTKMKMLGQECSIPVMISPMGVAKTAGDEGELALGAGAAAGGIIHCISTASSFSPEEIVTSAPKTYPFFFQLYVDRNRPKSEELLARLEKLDQVKALFVTVDLPVVSKREADERIRGEVPQRYYDKGAKPEVSKRGSGGLARSTGSFIEWCLDWDDLAWIRKHCSLPIIVKGIQSAADAKIAMQMGCAGIVVSNHGGRALDGSPATLLILLELRRDCPEVFDKMEVYVDGGVRRGSDILKAVCLGAHGVGVGRPFQCAVSYGTEGVEAVCESGYLYKMIERQC